MGSRGPTPRSHAAKLCGPHGLTAKPARSPRLATEDKPLPTEPPSWLPARARALWRHTLPEITSRATKADAETFASWCLACIRVRDLALATETNPKLGDELRAAQRVAVVLARELALTPASRSRVPETVVVEAVDAAKAAREARIAALVR